MKERVIDVSDGELLLKDVCEVFEEKGRSEAVLGAIGCEEEKADRANL